MSDREQLTLGSMWDAHEDRRWEAAAGQALHAADMVGARTAEGAAVLVAQAHVYATLALVEQQRIANLLTVAAWVLDSTKEDLGYDLDKLRTGVAGEVWEGLRL